MTKQKKHQRKKKKYKLDIDAILINVLIISLIIISVISIVLIRDFVGYVSYDEARGGVITELNIYQIFPAWMWNGVYGIVLSGVSLNTSWFVYANSAGMSELTMVVPCLEAGIPHELYATTLNITEIVWDNITAAPTQMLDDYVGITYNDSMSATQTFNESINISIGPRLITGVNITYMYRYNYPQSQAFPVGILQYNNTIIMVALINDNFLSGYRPDKLFNYEMMVPVSENDSDIRYNMYTDPYDFCPGGAEGAVYDFSEVYGWVTDSQTGAFLENALVAVGTEIGISDVNGFYNISARFPPGTYYIVAIKLGFNNYVGNVTIVENSSNEHNISMNLYQEPLTGTGPGVGTGVDDPGTETRTDEGVGPGVGPGIGPFVERPDEFGKDHFISLDRLYKKLRLNNFFTEHLLIFNFRLEPATVNVKVTGNASKLLELSESSVTIESGQYANISIRGLGLEEGEFTGSIEVSGDFNDTLPVQIIVSDKEKLQVEALLMNLEVLTNRPLPGNNFRFRINLQNLLIAESYDVRLDYFIRGVDIETSNNTLYVGNDTISLLTTHSIIKDVLVPPEWDKGDYYLIVEAYYLDLYSRTSTIFELFEPLYQVKVFGLLELWKILLALSILAAIIGTIIYIRHRIESKKRFHAKVEYNLLPKKGPRSIYVGKIAETENDTYFDMDKLTVHSIVAGSTGGGKTIAAQVIVEECLMKDTAVIVFDPTAQWSGMLRKCADQKMMSYYPRFHLTKKDSRAFNGNVRAIKNPREKINLKDYWKPGEIQIFTVNTLTPKEIDIFVANTVRAVFQSNLQEFRGLRFMMVYDEVHRLLPKFGGSGEGFIQVERACREFRKWGVGVLLISQVLADFVGQIKANINTEVQMKTRDEGDLKRIETKYGTSYVQELVKSPVGSGMVQNSSWNRGRPYYVTFRPILHSVVRLADEELEKYNKYNEIVDDLSYQLDQLEKEHDKDVFDLRLELKLSLDKIKQGGFNMVEIYLEGLTPRIEKLWKELGKKPKKRKVELVSEAALKASIAAAQKESEKAKESEAAGATKTEAKKLSITDDVPPDMLLNLANGMLVNKLKNLIDEIKAMKEPDFKKQVNETKNDFSDWIRKAYKNDKWADIADTILAKADYIKFLELLEQGKEKTFKVTTPRAKPYSSKKEVVSAQPAVAKAQQKPIVQKPGQPAQKPTQPAKPLAQPVAQKLLQVQQPKPVQGAQLKQLGQKPPAQPVAAQPQPPQPAKPSPLNWENIKQTLSGKSSQEKIIYYKDLLQKNPDDTNVMFSLAGEYHRVNDLQNAELSYKKILEKNPDNPKVLYYLGSVYNAQKKFKEALDVYNKVIKLQPDYPKVKEYIDSINKIMSQQVQVKTQ
ncbi:DUF87 domain-containing protein [Candidatus Pacearchaeota archaeon]|nr:DUF87 domain-containing protein [Candidatus Pacearchaeota archaeon]